MSGTSEIVVVDPKQANATLSPETTDSDGNGSVETAKNNGGYPAIRRRLPDERHSLTHHFSIGGQEGYVTVGLYEDGAPGEMFIRMAKEGSTVSGLMDSFATAVSLALQYGVPLMTNSATRDLSRADGRAIPRSVTPSHSWITCFAGSNFDS